MQIALINTGSELMLGRVLNSHQQWICRRLADQGYVVQRQVAIADDGRSIQNEVREALGYADLVITTGGLGPTSDDITRDLIAQLLHRSLREDPEVLANIESFFSRRGRPMPVSTRVQAMVPEGAVVLHNRHGTAPGLALCTRSAQEGRLPQWLILLPGPPRELHPMFLESVLPILHREYPRQSPFVCRTLRTVGLGESWVEEKIAGPLEQLTRTGLQIGYCARTGEVDVRLVSESANAVAVVAEAETICRDLLRDYVFGVDDQSLEEVVVGILKNQGKQVGFAESCTGGCIAHRLTNVPGASEVFRGGIVAYHNAIKQQVLSVPESVLREHGAVSEPTAVAMAEGARKLLGVDYAVSVTGIAGPGGGSAEKPVGLVYLGLSTASGTRAVRKVNAFDRETFKFVTSQQALNWLRLAALGCETQFRS